VTRCAAQDGVEAGLAELPGALARPPRSCAEVRPNPLSAERGRESQRSGRAGILSCLAGWGPRADYKKVMRAPEQDRAPRSADVEHVTS